MRCVKLQGRGCVNFPPPRNFAHPRPRTALQLNRGSPAIIQMMFTVYPIITLTFQSPADFMLLQLLLCSCVLFPINVKVGKRLVYLWEILGNV